MLIKSQCRTSVLLKRKFCLEQTINLFLSYTLSLNCHGWLRNLNICTSVLYLIDCRRTGLLSATHIKTKHLDLQSRLAFSIGFSMVKSNSFVTTNNCRSKKLILPSKIEYIEQNDIVSYLSCQGRIQNFSGEGGQKIEKAPLQFPPSPSSKWSRIPISIASPFLLQPLIT